MLTVLLIFLYRRAIQPAEKIKKAVLEYTGDKDTAKIVGNMQRLFCVNLLTDFPLYSGGLCDII